MAEDAIDVALRVACAIESVGGAYFVGGSVASSLQGEPRSTNDIDIVMRLPLGRIRGFVDALGADFEVDVDMLRDALLHGGSCNIFYLPTVMKVDLFAVGATPFDDVEFERRKAVKVRATGEELVLKTAEDSVLRKLLWYRQGGEVSDRQWRDVLEVLRVSGDALEADYMTTWAARLGVGDLLARARAEAAALSAGERARDYEGDACALERTGDALKQVRSDRNPLRVSGGGKLFCQRPRRTGCLGGQSENPRDPPRAESRVADEPRSLDAPRPKPATRRSRLRRALRAALLAT